MITDMRQSFQMQSCKKMSECSKSVLYLPTPSCESSVSVKGNLDRKKVTKNLDVAETGNFIRGSTKAGFCWCSTVKFPVAEPYLSEDIGSQLVTLLQQDFATGVFLQNCSERFFNLAIMNMLLNVLFKARLMPLE